MRDLVPSPGPPIAYRSVGAGDPEQVAGDLQDSWDELMNISRTILSRGPQLESIWSTIHTLTNLRPDSYASAIQEMQETFEKDNRQKSGVTQ